MGNLKSECDGPTAVKSNGGRTMLGKRQTSEKRGEASQIKKQQMRRAMTSAEKREPYREIHQNQETYKTRDRQDGKQNRA